MFVNYTSIKLKAEREIFLIQFIDINLQYVFTNLKALSPFIHGKNYSLKSNSSKACHDNEFPPPIFRLLQHT